MADLPDIAGFQVDGDRKAILQFVKTCCIQHGRRTIFRESLLGGGEKPHGAVADLFEVLGEPVQI